MFKLEGMVKFKKDALSIKDTGSLAVVLKSFRNLRGMLDGLVDLLFLRLLFDRERPQSLLVF